MELRVESDRDGESSRRNLIAGLFVMLMMSAAMFLGACGESGEVDSSKVNELAADSTSGETAKKPKKEKSSSVVVAEVIRGDLVIPIMAEGVIRARSSVGIRSEISGRITAIHCEEGQRVRRGQLLISLDERDYSVALSEARSLYLQALSQVAVEENLEELWEAEGADLNLTEVMSGDVREQIESLRRGEFRKELAASRTGLAAASAAEERARLNIERCGIRAPFDGVISELRLSKGEWVGANQDIFTITDTVDLEAEVNVLESDLGVLEVGRPVLIAVPALADTFSARVDIVNPILDTNSRSCRALLRINNESGRIKPGMFVRAAIAGQVLKDRLLVPREAVLTRDKRPLVFKVADGLSHWVYVELGERNESFVEIKRAVQGGTLDEGDPVVVSDNLTLTHGTKVKVKRTLKPNIPWKLDGGVQE